MSTKRLKKVNRNKRNDAEEERHGEAVDKVLFFDNELKQPAGYSVAHFFDTVVPAFGFFKAAEYSPPRHIIKFLFALEGLQIISLGLSPHFKWGDISNALAHAAYFQQLPLWDRRHIFVGYAPSAVIAILLSLVPIFALGLGVVHTLKTAEKPQWMKHYKRLLYAMTTWLFIPIFQFQLSMLVCHENVLWTNIDEQCDSAMVIIVRLVCFFGSGSLIILALVARTVLYDSEPLSTGLLSRSHSGPDFADLWIKVVTCILYHHFLARGEIRWFGLFITLAYVIGGAYWCYSYPYFRSETLMWRVAPLWMGAWCGALAGILETEAGYEWLREGQRDFVMLAIGLVIAFLLAMKLKDYRISQNYKEGMHVLTTYGRITCRSTHFPRGLEASPQRFKVYEELVDTLLPPDEDEGGGTYSEILRASYHFTIPCVDTVHTVSDCQVACRFLREYHRLTNQMPTRAMYIYALQLYLRGTLVFKDSGLLHLCIANFIVYHLKYETAAMRWLQAVDNADTTLAVRYQAWKLMQVLKVDNTYMERFERAKRNHLECLRRMHEFWKHLQAEHVDQVAMNLCASAIHLQSDSALSEYMHALRLEEGDRPLVKTDVPLGVNFGLFIEQVLGCEDVSERCFGTVSEFCQNSKTKAMAGAKRRANVASADVGVSQLPTLTEIKASWSGGENREHMDLITGRLAISQAQFVLNAVFCFLVLLILVFLALTAVTTDRRKLIINACSAAGDVRSLASQAMLVSYELAYSNPRYANPHATIRPELLADLRDNPYPREMRRSQLLGLTRELQTKLNEVTWGDSMPQFDPPEMLRKMWTKTYLNLDLLHDKNLSNSTQEAGQDFYQGSVWTALFNLVERLYQIQNTPVDELFPEDTNIQYIEKNGLNTLTDGLNRTILLYEEWNEKETLVMTLCLVVILACSIVLIMLVFVLLVTRFRGVERTRRNVRDVVTLTPISMMKKLEEQVYGMIHEFVKFRESPEQFLSERRYLEGGDDEGKLKLRSAILEDYAKDIVVAGEELTLDARASLEDNRRAKRDRIKAEQSGLSTSTFSLASKVLFLFLSVLVIGSLVCSMAIVGSWEALRESSLRTQQIESSQSAMSTNLLQLELEAERFVVTQNAKSYSSYIKLEREVIGSRTVFRQLMEYSSPCCDTQDIEHFSSAMHSMEKAIESQLVAMGLAARGLILSRGGTDEKVFTQATGIDPLDVAFSNSTKARQSDIFLRPSLADIRILEDPSNTNVTLTNVSDVVSTYTSLALSQIFSDAHVDLYDRTQKKFGLAYAEMWDASHHRLDESVKTLKLLIRIYWVCVALAAVTMVILTRRQTKDKLMNLRFVVASFCAFMVFTVVGIVFSVHDYQEYVSTVQHDLEDQWNCYQHERSAITSALLTGREAMIFTQTGDAYRWKKYQENLKEPGNLLGKIQNLQTGIIKGAAVVNVADSFKLALKELENMHTNEEIVFAMGYHVFPERQNALSELEKLTWNERDYDIIAPSQMIMFLTDIYHFTNESYDVEKWTNEDLKTIMTRTIFESWYANTHERFEEEILRGADIVCKGLEKSVDSRIESSEVYKLDVMYFSIGQVIVICVIFVNILRAFVFSKKENSANTGKGKSTGFARGSEAGALSKHIRRVTLALGLVACLICVIFVLCYMQLIETEGVARRLQESSARSWLVSRSMTLVDSLIFDERVNTRTTGYLEETWTRLREAEWNLFFHDFRGDFSGSYSGVASDAVQSKLLFGPESSIPSQSLYECNASLTQEVNNRIRGGVSLLYQDWKDGIQFILRGHENEADVAHRVARQRSLLLPLLEGIRESSKLYNDEAAGQQDSAFQIIIAVSLSSMLLILIVFFLVFRPLIHELEREERTTRLVLRMIPQECRELPDIVELLEMSRPTQREESDLQIAQAISDLSPYPVIAIDDKGIVLKATGPSLKEVFGYLANEVVGCNVKILMPQRYAQNHDQYLANYRRTGKKHLIDKLRNIVGVRKDGTEFEGTVIVRQYICESGDKVFFGCIRDVTAAQNQRLQARANECIRENSTAGLFITDETGIIRKVNRQGCDMFGWAREDLVGSHIKVLMSSQIASNHDSYVQKFRQTPKSEKHVSAISRQIALTKSGTQVLVNIKVQEIVHMRGVIYVAEIYDLTEQDQLENIGRVSDTVANLSRVPVVVLDPKGTILRFSESAEIAFGYSSRNTLGKNVKMLMPAEIAVKHDGYLKRYQETKIKYVVGTTREVVGRRSNGTNFPMKITVAEIEQRGVPPTFVGYCQDISNDKKTARQQEIADIVARNSAIPIITINNRGEVLSFSAMATAETQYTEAEVVGENIKQLMTIDVADKHDGYLEAYRRTGVKNVLGGKGRLVVVQRKDLSTFRALLKPYEIVSEEKTCEDVFVGFLSNQENTLMLGRTFLVNEAVSEISPVPMVVITHIGIVRRFSHAAVKAWGYEVPEVMGQNVKMLMAPTIGEHHDGYLSRYLRTGEKHVIDSKRKGTAVRKNGNEFPIEISVREVKKEGSEPMYVGYVRDISQDEALERGSQLGEQIKEYSPMPLLVIDSFGTIDFCNKAMIEEFMFTKEELLGHNIKMLMPQTVANRHDDYLLAFRQTGKKKIIGQTTRQVGKRKNLTRIPLDITVRDFTESRGTTKQVQFVGYLRDMTSAIELEEATRAVDVVVNLSSVPVIAIDHKGLIIKFSATAEKVFGYKSVDILGQNINILMPEDYKRKHDRALVLYRRTGKKYAVDSLRMQPAVTATGVGVQVELCVREVVQEGRDSVFVGYARDAREDFMIQQEEALINSIRDLSSAPVIVMNTQGTITDWNKAATTLFGYSREDVVGVFNSITKLQPQEIAVNHQSYLDSYLKTGIKKVIDTVRRVTGVHSSGREIPIEISVREMVREDKSRTFIGYVRDLSDIMEQEQQRIVSDAVCSLAVHPLIVIDHIGTIKKFSGSSERVWGYMEAELKGGNIKKIMPERYAVQHDMYLQRYQDTGVKTVVDTLRTVAGLRKNGEEFPCTIAVKEVKMDKMASMFVGYAMDSTESEALALARRVAESVSEHASVPVIQITQLGQVMKFNKAAANVFMYDPTAAIGKNIKMLMPDEYASQHDFYLSRYMSDGIKRVIGTRREAVARRSDGTTFPVELNIQEMTLDATSRVFLGYVRDITTMYVLQQATAVNDAITAISPIPVIAMSAKGLIFKFSKAATDLFGYTFEEIQGKNVSLLMPDEVRAKHDGYLRRYQETRVKKVVDATTTNLQGKNKDGTLFPVEISVRELRKEGQDSIFVGSLRDYTQDEIIHNSLSLAKAILDASALPIIGIDPQGIIHTFSKSAEACFGYSVDQVMGQSIETLMPKEVAVRHQSYLDTYMKTGVKHVVDSERRVTAVNSDGEEFPFMLKIKELTVDGERLFIGYAEDLRAEEEMAFYLRIGSTIESMIDSAVISIDHNGIIQTFNEAACAIFEFTETEVIGRNCKILMPEEMSVRHDSVLERYQATGEKVDASPLDTPRIVTGESKLGFQMKVEIVVRELKPLVGPSRFVARLKPIEDDEE
eukprot:Hpha_TRINITY_DN15503_c5_g2::TRINITY_DN15503_c5_g2_i1::g.104637::m.104637